MREPIDMFMKDDNIGIKTRELVSWLLNKKQDGFQPDDLFNYNYDQLEDYLVDLKPTSKQMVSTCSYVLGVYLKWCSVNGYCSNEQYQMVSDIDQSLIWKKVKPHVSKRFITSTQYEQILADIEKYEEHNSLYYETLFRCIYEGVFGENLTELKELRASNINGNMLTINKDDGSEITFEITQKLSENLVELSKSDKWARDNRFGTYYTELEGKYLDSCFKVVFRSNCKNTEEAYKFFYYNKIRKISNMYVGYKMRPLHIYHSGIINRICQELVSKGIKIADAFSDRNRNPVIKQIIDAETNRVGYTISSNALRFHILSYKDMFIEEYD